MSNKNRPELNKIINESIIPFNDFLSSNRFDGTSDFRVLKNKRTNRCIIFLENDKRAIKMMKIKFRGKNKIIYYLIKLGILGKFLPKIRFNRNIGQLIFIGGQIKIFDFNNMDAISLPLFKEKFSDFIKDKRIQKRASKYGIASEIKTLDEKYPYSIDSLEKPYTEKEDLNSIFSQLTKFYSINEKYKKTYSNLEKEISSILKDKKDNFSNIKKFLEKIKNKNKEFIFCQQHHDFGYFQLLKKSNKILISDWGGSKTGIITEDLINYFKDNETLPFPEILDIVKKLYPKEVNDNIWDYLILTNIYLYLDNKITNIVLNKRLEDIIDKRD